MFYVIKADIIYNILSEMIDAVFLRINNFIDLIPDYY